MTTKNDKPKEIIEVKRTEINATLLAICLFLNVVVIFGIVLTAHGQSTNLVINGDFSNGLTGWTNNDGGAEVISGTLQATQADGFAIYIQTITLTPNKTYNYAITCRGTQTTVEINDNVSGYTNIACNTAMTTHTGTYSTTETETTIQIILSTPPDSAVDNVILTDPDEPTPTPTTTATPTLTPTVTPTPTPTQPASAIYLTGYNAQQYYSTEGSLATIFVNLLFGYWTKDRLTYGQYLLVTVITVGTIGLLAFPIIFITFKAVRTITEWFGL